MSKIQLKFAECNDLIYSCKGIRQILFNVKIYLNIDMQTNQTVVALSISLMQSVIFLCRTSLFLKWNN